MNRHYISLVVFVDGEGREPHESCRLVEKLLMKNKAVIRADSRGVHAVVLDPVGEEIHKGMARAFFASAWADAVEEAGGSLRGEIMDQIPDKWDKAAWDAADRLYTEMSSQNWSRKKHAHVVAEGAYPQYDNLSDFYHENTGGLDPLQWGHYAAMESMGHGVGLWEYGLTDRVKVPRIEFGAYSLDKRYKPEQ